MASSPTPPPPPPHPPLIVVDVEVERADRADLQQVVIVQHQQVQLQQPLGQTPPNPLLIDVVLDNMFGYCDFKDLSQCRRVSSLWHKVSLPHWLRKAPRLKLHLDPDHYDDDDDGRTGRRVLPSTTVVNFLGLVDNDFHSYEPYELAGLRQYKNFGVQGDLGVGIQHHFLRLFLRTFGHAVGDLSLSLRFPDLESYRAVMLSTMSPNLVKLEVDDASFADDVINQLGDYSELEEEEEEVEGEEHTNLRSLHVECNNNGRVVLGTNNNISALPVIGWIRFLKRYPNLQTISYGVKRTAEPQGADRMLEAIWSIRQLEQKVLNNLKRLEICCRSINGLPSLLPLLRDSQLALETFGLTIGNNIPNQTISDLLTSPAVANSLKHLIIQNGRPLKGFQPPRMELVESLELHGYPFENLSFLKSFPSLKSLSFNSEGLIPSKLHSILNATTREHLRGATATTTSSSLTRLHCNYYEDEDYNHYTMSSRDVTRLHALLPMPNLADLKLRLNNASFRTVCQFWPRLQHLTIVGDGVDDEGIAGISPEELELRTLRMVNFDKAYLNNAGPTGITENSFPEFLLLPKLEKLEVSVPFSELDLDATLVRRIKQQIRCFKLNWAVRREEEEEEARPKTD